MAVKAITTQPIDIDKVKELYGEMSKLVYADMNKQWNENKINGSKYADTWAALMKAVVSDSISAVVSLQNNETDADRCVKQAECDLKAAQTLKVAAEESLVNAQETQVIAEKDKILYETANILPEHKNLAIADIALKTSQKAQTDSQKAKIDYETQNILPEQKNFTIRQTEGFDDNIRQKMFETQMNSWAMMYSSGIMGDVVPSIISETEANKLWKKLKAEANVV